MASQIDMNASDAQTDGSPAPIHATAPQPEAAIPSPAEAAAPANRGAAQGYAPQPQPAYPAQGHAGWPQSPPQAQPAYAPQPAQAYVPAMYGPPSHDAQRMMLYDANKKSTGLAYALWFFLGWAGAHRFYLNRAESGAGMLVLWLASFFLSFVFVGVFGFVALGVWILIDAFMIPDWIRDHNNRLVAGLSQ